MIQPPRRRGGAAFVSSLAVLLPMVLGGARAAAQVTAAPQAQVVTSLAIPDGGSPFQATTTCATFSVPLAQAWHVGLVGGRPALSVLGSGRWQVRALDVWPDGSVKWAQCVAQVTAGVGVPAPALAVSLGSGVSAQAPLASTIPGGVRVDTGPLQADLRASGFNLLDRVVVDGAELVKPGTSPGIVAKLVGGASLSASGTVLSITENGPARATVRADGALVGPGGAWALDFTCRLVFVAGSRDVELTFTVRNANIAHPQHAVLESLELVVRAAPGSARAVARGHAAGPLSLSAWGGSTAGAARPPPPPPPRTWRATAPASCRTCPRPGTARSPSPPRATRPARRAGALRRRQGELARAVLGRPDGRDRRRHRGHPADAVPVARRAGGARQRRRDGRHLHAQEPRPYTFCWRQHESRTVVFSFHTGRRRPRGRSRAALDVPVVGRLRTTSSTTSPASSPPTWSRCSSRTRSTRCWASRTTVAIAQHGAAGHALPAGARPAARTTTTTSSGCWAASTCALAPAARGSTRWTCALYKSRVADPAQRQLHARRTTRARATTALPHSEAYAGDDEHRYRDGMALAYWLTGDERIRDALLDEAEILLHVPTSAQERSRTRPCARWPRGGLHRQPSALLDGARARLECITPPCSTSNTQTAGCGWDDRPAHGQRGATS